MKFVAEYLRQAAHFEQLATETDDATLKDQLLEQAADYRRLADKRSAQLGLPTPPQLPPRSPRRDA
jgi:hypothetical protein